jgi:uncharacterized protein YcbK (DUF882 family)
LNFRYFSADEFTRIGSDASRMDVNFMDRLSSLRDEINQPLPLSSAWRSESRNRQANGAKNSAHLYGRAVDLRIHGDTAYRVVSMAARYGFTGIGVHQRGIVRGRFIHLDDMKFSEGSKDRPRPTIWSYE